MDKCRCKSGLLYLPGIEDHYPQSAKDDAEYNEVPDRITMPYERLLQSGLLDYMHVYNENSLSPKETDTEVALIRNCTTEEMLSCHHKKYINKMESIQDMNDDEVLQLSKKFDNVSLSQTSFNYAKKVAGSVIEFCDKIVNGELNNGFALVRPPSHHSECEMGANGYCLLNTTAITVKHLLQKRADKCKRVLIVDWDVHHGQGTQSMFYDDKNVLYISLHCFQNKSFFPYLSESDIFHTGSDNAKGYNINIAWDEEGMGDTEYMAAFLQIILPVAYSFDPDFVLISAGFDCLEGDLEGKMKVSPACLAHITHHLKAIAKGKLLVLFEGGYNPPIVADGVQCVTQVLLGITPPVLHLEEEINPSAVQTILDVISLLSDYWTCFQFQEDREKEAESYTLPCKEEYQVTLMEVTDNSAKLNQSKAVVELKDELDYDKKFGYCFDPKMLLHKREPDENFPERPDHPERPERIASINSHLKSVGLLDRCLLIEDHHCDIDRLKLIHSEDYIKAQKDFHASYGLSGVNEDEHAAKHGRGSIYHNKHSYESALVSAGCLIHLTSLVLNNSTSNHHTQGGDASQPKITSGFANIRPPGHHAEVNKEFGFCFFNNVSLATQYALADSGSGVRRVLILDWDVHHGNGTQNQFENNPNVLYISLHRHGFFFPGGPDGGSDRVGCGKGVGFNVNIPWLTNHATDLEYISAFTNVVLPIVYEFNPDLVLVSSGFDSAIGDPLGEQNVSPECFAHMTHMLMAFASGKIIIALEGGYNLRTISRCAEQCVRTLLKEPCPRLPVALGKKVILPDHRKGIVETIWHHRKFWKQLRFLKSVDEVVTKPSESVILDDECNANDQNGGNKIVHSINSEPPPEDTELSILYWRRYWNHFCSSNLKKTTKKQQQKTMNSKKC